MEEVAVRPVCRRWGAQLTGSELVHTFDSLCKLNQMDWSQKYQLERMVLGTIYTLTAPNFVARLGFSTEPLMFPIPAGYVHFCVPQILYLNMSRSKIWTVAPLKQSLSSNFSYFNNDTKSIQLLKKEDIFLQLLSISPLTFNHKLL